MAHWRTLLLTICQRNIIRVQKRSKSSLTISALVLNSQFDCLKYCSEISSCNIGSSEMTKANIPVTLTRTSSYICIAKRCKKKTLKTMSFVAHTRCAINCLLLFSLANITERRVGYTSTLLCKKILEAYTVINFVNLRRVTTRTKLRKFYQQGLGEQRKNTSQGLKISVKIRKWQSTCTK